jgi:hypothetical protein
MRMAKNLRLGPGATGMLILSSIVYFCFGISLCCLVKHGLSGIVERYLYARVEEGICMQVFATVVESKGLSYNQHSLPITEMIDAMSIGNNVKQHRLERRDMRHICIPPWVYIYHELEFTKNHVVSDYVCSMCTCRWSSCLHHHFTPNILPELLLSSFQDSAFSSQIRSCPGTSRAR